MSRLIKEAEQKPGKLQQLHANEILLERKRDAIEDAASKILASDKPITRIQHVQAAVLVEHGLEVNRKLAREVMRKEMRLGYRLAKVVAVQSNSERCLVLLERLGVQLRRIQADGVVVQGRAAFGLHGHRLLVLP